MHFYLLIIIILAKFTHKIANAVVVVDLPLLCVAVEGSDNPISLEKPCQASLPPDQQGHHSLVRHPEVQYGPGLDSMSPARSRRSASHAVWTHKKNWAAGASGEAE